jgi:hypothetical protein
MRCLSETRYEGTEPSQTENASLYDVDGFILCQQVQLARKHAKWHSGEISKSRYRWTGLVSFAYSVPIQAVMSLLGLSSIF